MYKEDNQLWREVERLLRPFSLPTSTKKLLIGVSGGADSLALLHLLWQRLGSDRLVVGHLNHQLRPEADDEAAFVAKTAAAWNIPCVLEQVAVAELAEGLGLSLEAAGRLARYRFLTNTAVATGAAAVVVAHHADDQTETVLLHLLRGSGSGGLRGMLPVSVVPQSDGMALLRPFLTTRRAAIEAYCARHDLHYRHDSTNDDVQYTRNRIRHELLPLLQTYNPQIHANLQHLAAITADEFAALQTALDKIWPELLPKQGKAWLTLDRVKFQELGVAWQRLALRRVVQQLRPLISEIGFATIEQARTLILANKSGTEATLPGGLVMWVSAEEVFFGAAEPAWLGTWPQMIDRGAVLIPVPGEVRLANGWLVQSRWVEQPDLADLEQNDDPWRAYVAVGDEGLWVRPFHPGERFQPLGMAGQSQKIADLLSNRKVAGPLRPLWPIVVTAQHPVWIVGLQIDERMRVTENRQQTAVLRCLRVG